MARIPRLCCLLVVCLLSTQAGVSAAVLHGGGAVARTDTLSIYGGPGVLEGKFESDFLMPDEQGWYGVDRTAQGATLWQVTDYHAAALDPAEPENHAWWCGEIFPDDCGTSEPGGYGNNLDQRLARTFTVPDPGLSTAVRLTAKRRQDTEPGYDHLVLERETATAWVEIDAWTGTIDADVDVTVELTPADYLGADGDGISLRWYAHSDGAWSDADCLWPTDGHTRLDRIEVTLDQGAGPVSQGVETCEPGDPQLWTPAQGVGVGDFARIWPMLSELDPCMSNWTPQWAFIDDGVVVPCTGGTFADVWTYGPNGFVTNVDGGCSDVPGAQLNNEIWSPALALSPAATATRLAFDLYAHLPFFEAGYFHDTFWIWHVRSSLDGGATWSSWRSDNFIERGEAEYVRFDREITQYLLPGATHLQIALGVFQYDWGVFGPLTSTPAPYYDNVRVQQWSYEGPSLSADERHLAGDAFPASGLLDGANPGANSVRFDMSMDICGTTAPGVVRGDSIVVTALSLRAGAELVSVDLHYLLRRNSLFDPWRTAGLPDAGIVMAQLCMAPGGLPVPDRWCFDLPDDGFLFPGDQLHYYISATDAVLGVPGSERTTTLPADLTGYGEFPGMPIGIPDAAGGKSLRRVLYYGPDSYPRHFTVNALPTVTRLEPLGQRKNLVWIDCDETEVLEMLTTVDLQPDMGVLDFDVFATHSPGVGAGNGLGANATASQLDGYRNIIYVSGGETAYTLTGPAYVSGNGTPNSGDKGDDLGLLEAWLAGDRGLFATGDHLVMDLEGEASGAGTRFVADRLGVELLANDVGPLIDGQIYPLCRTTDDLPFSLAYDFAANGGCPQRRTFDAVRAVAPGTLRITEYLTPWGSGGAYDYGAVFKRGGQSDDQRLVFAPIALSAWGLPVQTKAMVAPLALREQLLADVLGWLGMLGIVIPGVDDPPAPVPFYARTHPNPFNPLVVIEYGLPRAGAARITVHDVRGRLLRTLVDAEQPAGPQSTSWDGRDAGGRSLGSGVYFARIEAAGERAVRKLSLVR